MKEAYRRHDISDEVWELLRPQLPGQPGQWGGIAEDNRQYLNGVFWILRTGAHGGICRHATETGTAWRNASAVGVSMVSGRNCLKS